MKNNGPKNQVRIIAGKWRARKISFPAVLGLRPSSDRVRETLFNWLMHDIVDSYCLDLFAGSGILGLEALSRGAARVVAVDQSHMVIKALQQNAQALQASNLQCICASWPEVLSQLEGPFDLVFLDPPFKQGLVEPCCAWLEDNNLLKTDTKIYIEQEISAKLPLVPQGWQLYREMKTQQVRTLLYRAQPLKKGAN